MTPLTLIRPHTHAGKTYPAGERLELDPAQAHWLIGAGVARAVIDPPSEPPPFPDLSPKPRKETKP